MSLFVRYAGRLVPRLVFEPDDRQRGSCWRCGGTGKVIESLDDELPDEVIPCPYCRILCQGCGKYVKKSGHACAGEKP